MRKLLPSKWSLTLNSAPRLLHLWVNSVIRSKELSSASSSLSPSMQSSPLFSSCPFRESGRSPSSLFSQRHSSTQLFLPVNAFISAFFLFWFDAPKLQQLSQAPLLGERCFSPLLLSVISPSETANGWVTCFFCCCCCLLVCLFLLLFLYIIIKHASGIISLNIFCHNNSLSLAVNVIQSIMSKHT